MRLIPLEKGKFAKVDDEDFERVIKHKWKLMIARKGTANPYARTWIKGQVLMHHLVLGRKIRTDHQDGDSLNNQKQNLRPATTIENARNRKIQVHSTNFKGVSFVPSQNQWQASGCLNKKKVHIGTYNSTVLAALAYDTFAQAFYGNFARTNQQMGAL